ncbi:hypothetical protein N0V88_006536 [Collariella sp. IMI 366227]|nr:hypothetical protein N0V88_006536 [Collariella sp. IMI 366227]
MSSFELPGMGRPRRSSGASEDSTGTVREQELGSMYDYLAKVILLGPSGTGKSCLLHRFVKNEWRVLSSQTIGVEFASKIIKLWDTAGTERFRSVSRSYYRAPRAPSLSTTSPPATPSTHCSPSSTTRALASPNLSLLLVGNKLDLANDDSLIDTGLPPPTPSSSSLKATVAPDGREVTAVEAGRWASTVQIPVTMEVSAFSGRGWMRFWEVGEDDFDED